ncbi:MAG TPA: helix-turn-helix domain-containing protein [Burkholderiales bacterium]|nr:helix-turn-helix domain-containing protein [Burkholderiales bacterium]
MQAAQTQFDIRAIQSSWAAFESMVHLRSIHDETGYDQMVALMNSLLDEVGDDEDHALSGLLELVGDVVSKYEREHYAIEPAAPKDSLRFLIEARGLNQESLSAVVPQSNLSAILAGKRKISATLAGKLGKFFGVSPALFVPR